METLKKLVEEYNKLLDDVNAKWDEIYTEIEKQIDSQRADEIGSIIASSMDVSNLDPYEQLKIDFETLKREVR